MFERLFVDFIGRLTFFFALGNRLPKQVIKTCHWFKYITNNKFLLKVNCQNTDRHFLEAKVHVALQIVTGTDDYCDISFTF
jgi:hypothetical protein